MIKVTNVVTGAETFEHVGRVVEVKKFTERRNHSDTLDYSDWRMTDCTTALVYMGRVAENDFYDWKSGGKSVKKGDALSIPQRFKYVDCTNLFTWRNGTSRTAVLDDPELWSAELREDLELYKAHVAAELEQVRVQNAQREEQDRLLKEEQERNRPVLGKKMTVVKGRKVPIGTEGTVAYISNKGTVLLKDDASWRDRKADGVWVSASNLAAR